MLECFSEGRPKDYVQAPEAEEEMVKSGVEAAIFVQCLNRLKFSIVLPL